MGDSVMPLLLLLTILHPLQGLLFPRDSPSRSSKSLDGVWNFKLSPKLDQDAGFRESWFNEPLSHLGLQIILKKKFKWSFLHRWCSWDACSSQLQWHHYKQHHQVNMLKLLISANPLFTLYNKIWRDYVGWAWYDTQFYVFQGWQDSRVMLRSVLVLFIFQRAQLSPFLQVRKCSLHSHGVPQWPVCHRPLRRSPPIWGRCHRRSQILRKV